MKASINTIIYHGEDLESAKAIFGVLLGEAPYVDSPYYVGYKIGDVEVGLTPGGQRQGPSGLVGYYDVEDIHVATSELVTAGASIKSEATDVGGGMLIATLEDGGGNTIGLKQVPRS
jgi:predicted enzyme related to lactoylglutathione lyase